MAALPTMTELPTAPRRNATSRFVVIGGVATTMLPARPAGPRRSPEDLFAFLHQHLDQDDWPQFCADLTEAAATYDRDALLEVLADWEETAEINADPELAADINAALDEYDQLRSGR